MDDAPRRNVQIVCGEESEECMSGVHVCYPSGILREVEPEQVSRCGVLRDLAHIYGTAELPFTSEEFGLWQGFRSSDDGEVDLIQAGVLLKVAGFLQDSMTSEWARLVGSLLTTWCRASAVQRQKDFSCWAATLHTFQHNLPDDLMLQVLEHACLRTILTTGTEYLHRAAVAARVERSKSLGVHLNLGSELLGPTFSLACDFVPNPITVTAADVSWNSLEPVGTRSLSHCIKHMASLRRLDVSNNIMNPEVADLLSHGLAYTTTLTELNLSGNKLCAEGFQCISTALFALTSLEVLDLSDNDLCVSVDHMDAVRDYEDPGASQQPPPISDIGIGALNTFLEQSSSLRELVLSGNMLGHIGMRGIMKGLLSMPVLEHLDLQHNHLLNAGCEVVTHLIHENNQLKYLNLSTNTIDGSGAQALWRCVCTCKSLVRLDILQNQISHEHVLQSLEDRFSQLPPTLQKIDLRMNGIVWQDARRLQDSSKGFIRCY